MSHSNFKLRFSERSLDLIREFQFQFGVISEVWLPVVIMSVKNGHYKARNMSDSPSNDRKMMSHSNFKLRFPETYLDLVRGFQFEFDLIWEVWLPVVIIQLKNGHCKTRNVGQSGQRRKMMSHSNFKLRLSERSLDVVRGFLFQFWCNLRSLVTRGSHLLENWQS